MSGNTTRFLAAIAACVPSFLSVGCFTTKPQQIGSNHVAVLSVTRWDDYKSELQPRFDVTANQAFAAAVPDTLQLEEAIQHAFQASLALKLAPSASLPAGFGAGQSGEGLSGMAAPTGAPDVAPPPTVTDKASLKVSPHLQYLAGTALYQEIKLLNRYVDDAAIRHGYRAYVVRMQVSTMPRTRGLAVDSYSDISLFFHPFEKPLSTKEERIRYLQEKINNARPSTLQTTQPVSGTSAPNPSVPVPTAALAQSVVPAIQPDPPPVIQNPIEPESIAAVAPVTQSAPAGVALNPIDPELIAAFIDAAKQNYQQLSSTVKMSADFIDAGNTDLALAKLKELQELFKSDKFGDPRNPTVSELKGLLDKAIESFAETEVSVPYTQTPLIIPLLVTDEVESAIAARRADDLQQLTFSLAAAYAGIGGQVDLQNIDRAMRTAMGRDYNSLFSVARVNDNTLRVRFGARQTGSNASDTAKTARSGAAFELTNQTHNVSLLVLIPKELATRDDLDVFFGVKSSFVDIATGTPLNPAPSSDAVILQRLQNKATGSDEYAKLLKGDANLLRTVAMDAQNSRYDSFLNHLGVPSGQADPREQVRQVAIANRLWLELAADGMDNPFDGGRFTVPSYRKLLVDNQPTTELVLLTDDGKKITTTLQVPEHTDPLNLNSSLLVGTLGIGASQAVLNNGQLSLTFPSIKDVKIGATPIQPTDIKELRVKSNDFSLFASKSIAYKLTVPDKKPIATVTLDRVLLAPNPQRQDEPNIVIVLDKDFKLPAAGSPDSAYPALLIGGASLRTPLPPDWTDNTAKPGTFVVKKVGRLPIVLGGLVPGTEVKFTLFSPSDAYGNAETSLKVADLPKP